MAKNEKFGKPYIQTKHYSESQKEPVDYNGSGVLFLTSGGRIVIDCGWGEYFNNSDTPIFTLDELRLGMKPEDFIAKIVRKVAERDQGRL